MFPATLSDKLGKLPHQQVQKSQGIWGSLLREKFTWICNVKHVINICHDFPSLEWCFFFFFKVQSETPYKSFNNAKNFDQL